MLDSVVEDVGVKALSGYAHGDYVASLAGYGTPRLLPRSGGWILERPIEGSTYRDAMGCYPLFACRDWSQLAADLEDIGDLVCLSLVADPFGDYGLEYLRRCFPDVVLPFKQHCVIDLSRPRESFVHPHHRRNARKALERVSVEVCEGADAVGLVDEWCGLYDNLIARHSIRGITSFSRQSFAQQLAVPGMTAIRATHGGETVGMTLWYSGDDIGYYHLGAHSDSGYDLRASFAIFWRAIEYFASRNLRWLNLGAGAGANAGGASGLDRFKQGWSTGVRPAYFCGRIFDRKKYERLVRLKDVTEGGYFPAYRVGEFG